MATATWTPDDPEYYNDLPGKVPPDFGPPPVPPLPNYHAPSGSTAAVPASPVASASFPLSSAPSGNASAGSGLKKGADRQPATRHGAASAVDLSDNLIDLNSDLPLARAEAGATGGHFPDHEYVNGVMGSSDFKSASNVKDPFDMREFCASRLHYFPRSDSVLHIDPFSGALPSPLPSALLPPMAGANGNNGLNHNSNVTGGTIATAVRTAAPQKGPLRALKTKATPHEIQLSQEIWFHGPISRKEAEDLLKHVNPLSWLCFVIFVDNFLKKSFRMEIFWCGNPKDPRVNMC